MRPTFPIHSIFDTWQAEGLMAGTPTVFIRFAGCNFKCIWCDTDFSLKRKLTANEIAGAVYDIAAERKVVSVCLTGGEPCIHDLAAVMDEIEAMFHVPVGFQIETNGTMGHEKYLDRAFVTVSPKGPRGEPVDQGEFVCHQLKVVYQGQDLSGLSCYFPSRDGGVLHGHHYVQPLYDNGEMNWQACLRAVQNHPGWKISFQTNKWVGAE